MQLLDVREPDEWAAGQLEGSIHIPLGVLPVRLGERLPLVTPDTRPNPA